MYLIDLLRPYAPLIISTLTGVSGAWLANLAFKQRNKFAAEANERALELKTKQMAIDALREPIQLLNQQLQAKERELAEMRALDRQKSDELIKVMTRMQDFLQEITAEIRAGHAVAGRNHETVMSKLDKMHLDIRSISS